MHVHASSACCAQGGFALNRSSLYDLGHCQHHLGWDRKHDSELKGPRSDLANQFCCLNDSCHEQLPQHMTLLPLWHMHLPASNAGSQACPDDAHQLSRQGCCAGDYEQAARTALALAEHAESLTEPQASSLCQPRHMLVQVP